MILAWRLHIQTRNDPVANTLKDSTMTNITITSAAADSVATGTMQLIARWKSTENNPISAANRLRAVILPANIWTQELHTMSDSLRLFVHDAIEDLARKYLSTICQESNWLRTEVNQDAFSLASLLKWNAEQAALSGRLNGDEIKKWLTESVTIATVATKHGAKIAEALGNQFVKLASPNHGLTPEKADKLLSQVWATDDADSTTGLRVMLRLQSIRDRAQAEANLLDSIL